MQGKLVASFVLVLLLGLTIGQNSARSQSFLTISIHSRAFRIVSRKLKRKLGRLGILPRRLASYDWPMKSALPMSSSSGAKRRRG